MKSFDFQKFSILQSEKVFRVGTDAVLLGALVEVKNAKKILEIGTGTGIISLMMAQRNPMAEIFALDIDPNAVNLAGKNFENSIFASRLSVFEMDFKTFQPEEKFDLVVCNPPYFERNSLSEKDILARQQVALNFDDLIEKTAKILQEKGIFSVIIPKNEAEKFIQKCENLGLNLKKEIQIKGNQNSEIKRSILEFFFSKIKKLQKDMIVLEQAPRKYSEQYLELTKDFHIFKNTK